MSIVEGAHALEFLLSEARGVRSRADAVLNSGQNCIAGTVLGRLLTAGAATAVGTPTGDGAITIGAAIGKNTTAGTYKLVCLTADTDAGTFGFYSPKGTLITQIEVGGGATSSDHLTVTIADGATDFAAGDTWTVDVTAGDYEQFDPAEDDGAQIAAGILGYATDATDGDRLCLVFNADCEVIESKLVWPDGITAGEKSAAKAQLTSLGIVIR